MRARSVPSLLAVYHSLDDSLIVLCFIKRMNALGKTIALILVVVICTCLTVISCCDAVPFDELPESLLPNKSQPISACLSRDGLDSYPVGESRS